jgi:hypothetical protein
MRSGRISLAGIVAVVAACALTLAALKVATEFWLGVAAALTALGLLFVSIRAVTGPARPFWAASAVSGGLYLMLAFTPWCRAYLGPRLPSDGLLEWAHQAIGPQPRARIERYDRSARVTSSMIIEADDGSARQLATHLLGDETGWTYALEGGADLDSLTSVTGSAWTSAAAFSDDREVFGRIGHLVEAWALALIGGLMGHGVGSLIRCRKALDRVTPGSEGATGCGNGTSLS